MSTRWFDEFSKVTDLVKERRTASSKQYELFKKVMEAQANIEFEMIEELIHGYQKQDQYIQYYLTEIGTWQRLVERNSYKERQILDLLLDIERLQLQNNTNLQMAMKLQVQIQGSE